MGGWTHSHTLAPGLPTPCGSPASLGLRGESEGGCLWREVSTISEIYEDLRINKRKTSSPEKNCQKCAKRGLLAQKEHRGTDGRRDPAPASTGKGRQPHGVDMSAGACCSWYLTLNNSCKYCPSRGLCPSPHWALLVTPNLGSWSSG